MSKIDELLSKQKPILPKTLPTKKEKKKKESNYNSGWIEVGGQRIFVRSSYEKNFTRFLQYRVEIGEIKGWEYEPTTFYFEKIKRGCSSYRPDYRITNLDGSQYWIELKGWLDPKSKTKLKRFAKYFPDEKMVLVEAAEYKQIAAMFHRIIVGWE